MWVVYFQYFENISNDWIFGEFLKNPGIWEISEISQIYIGIWGWYFLRIWKFFKWLDIWGFSQKPRHLGNFYRYPGIWDIPKISRNLSLIHFKILENSQMAGYLGNFPKTLAFGKFARYPGIWESNCVFATNSEFIIPIALEANVVHFWYI